MRKELQQSQEFDLGDILCVTTGRFVASTGTLSGLCDVLEYMTGERPFTHQIPRAMQECAPYILNQYPQLKEVGTLLEETTPGTGKEWWIQWLNEQKSIYGNTLLLSPIPRDQQHSHNLYQETVDLVGEERVICISVDDISKTQQEAGGSNDE